MVKEDEAEGEWLFCSIMNNSTTIRATVPNDSTAQNICNQIFKTILIFFLRFLSQKWTKTSIFALKRRLIEDYVWFSEHWLLKLCEIKYLENGEK